MPGTVLASRGSWYGNRPRSYLRAGFLRVKHTYGISEQPMNVQTSESYGKIRTRRLRCLPFLACFHVPFSQQFSPRGGEREVLPRSTPLIPCDPTVIMTIPTYLCHPFLFPSSWITCNALVCLFSAKAIAEAGGDDGQVPDGDCLSEHAWGDVGEEEAPVAGEYSAGLQRRRGVSYSPPKRVSRLDRSCAFLSNTK